jgi:hypothetical protein
VFDNCQRNANLQSANPSLKLEKTMKTGTTIVGLIFKVSNIFLKLLVFSFEFNQRIFVCLGWSRNGS